MNKKESAADHEKEIIENERRNADEEPNKRNKYLRRWVVRTGKPFLNIDYSVVCPKPERARATELHRTFK